MRAGEAKLRGRMAIDILIAGLPRCEFAGVRSRFSALCPMLFIWFGFKCLLVLLFVSGLF